MSDEQHLEISYSYLLSSSPRRIHPLHIGPRDDMATGVAPRAAGRAWVTRHVASYFLAGLAAITCWTVYISFARDQATSGAWGCEMSWMTPAYVRVPWRDPPSTKYALYLYREQGWDGEQVSLHTGLG